MRLYGPTGVRQTPTDRNPTTIMVGGNQTQNFGGTTVFATYTVPAARRFIGTVGEVAYIVTIALNAGTIAAAECDITPSGGAATVLARVESVAAAAAGDKQAVTPGQVQLKAGDLIIINAQVGPTAGQIHAFGGINGVEYDA